MSYQSHNLAKNEVEKINRELHRVNCQIEQIEDSISITDGSTVELKGDQEKMEDRIDHLEEEVTSLKVQNIELRKHLNWAIEELNNVTALLNSRYYGYLLEEAYELSQ